jgi:Methylene-tetrahydrofolate reductase C terminal
VSEQARPVSPRVRAGSMYRLHRLLHPNPGYRRLASWLERAPKINRLFTAGEERIKEQLFGCRMCGQCALPYTGFACPATCPKELRNGPCGGVGQDGSCEVYPAVKCIWLVAYERAEAEGKGSDLLRLQRPLDHRRWGESSWINYWQGRDENLCTADDGLAAPAVISIVGLGQDR